MPAELDLNHSDSDFSPKKFEPGEGGLFACVYFS
jgi:hypothetical protein